MRLTNKISLPERFERQYIPEPNSGCWLWIGVSNSQKGKLRYGYIGHKNKKLSAHRYSYERFIDIIPEGLVLDHLCKITLCVNPNHLEAVTQKTNILRGETGKYKRPIKSHCLHGHEFTKENSYINKNTKRCRKCANLSRQKLNQKRSINL